MDENCAVLAYYGVRRREPAVEFYEIIEAWFVSHQLQVSQGSVTSNKVKKKKLPGKALKATVQEHAGEIEDLSIMNLLPDAKIPLTDWALTAWWSRKLSMVFLGSREWVCDLEGLAGLNAKLCTALDPIYGIGYSRPHHLGPTMYAMGICQGLGFSGADREEGLNIARWGDVLTGPLLTKGLLRDVYPVNILSAVHLNLVVEGKNLAEWISESTDRGVLRALDDHNIWTMLPPQIDYVRTVLRAAGVLFDRKRDIPGAK